MTRDLLDQPGVKLPPLRQNNYGYSLEPAVCVCVCVRLKKKEKKKEKKKKRIRKIRATQ